MKDSITNILASKQFSVQIISEWYLDAANHSCGAFPSHVDEYQESGMSKEECQAVKASRVKESGVTYECEVVHVHNIQNSNGMPSTEIVLAKVVQVHVDETLLVKDFDPLKPEVDTTKLRPLGRLGGNLYSTLGEIVDIPRPQV
jgi:flavin reductase (DIM6/NTAB) family NADH-FMN oxidoreductase RutF